MFTEGHLQTFYIFCFHVGPSILVVMEKDEVFEVVKVTEEVESCYKQMDATTPKKRKNKSHDCVEKPKKPRYCFKTIVLSPSMALSETPTLI